MRNVKNITIAFLMLCALIQLSNIWSINVQNFFSNSIEFSYNEDLTYEILIPSSVLVDEEGLFRLSYNAKEENLINSKEISLLKSTVNFGVFNANEKLELEELVKSADVVYRYSSIIEPSLLEEVFGVKATQFYKNDILFDKVFVNIENNKVYFYNSESLESFSFTLNNLSITKKYEYNDNVGFIYNENDVNYLVPIVIEEEFYNLKETNPYSENNELSFSTVESKINRYFTTSNEKWIIFGDDSWAFSDEDTTVKYFNNNILEYRNNYESSKKTDKATAYAIAKSFIDTDEFITNDLVLKGTKSIANSYIFYFNPVVNETEVVFDNDELEYYIEIEVRNGVVNHYRKYVMNYKTDSTVNRKIEKDMNVFVLEEHFDSIELVYYKNIENETADLSWAMAFGEGIIYTEAD